MKINPKLMKVLCKELGVTVQRVYQLIKKRRKACDNLITDNQAIFLIASENENIDVTKFADEKMLEKLRELKGRIIINKNSKNKKQIINKITNIRLDRSFKIQGNLLAKNTLSEAKEMSKIYPYLYVFENSVRTVIQKVLEKHGKNWWDTKVIDKIKLMVKGRKNKEEKNPWHGKRGAHQIYYTDINDLKGIIRHNWEDFKKIFPSQSWIDQRIEEIEISRNIVAHNNPLSKDDIDRIKIYFKDWSKQISAKRKEINLVVI